MRTTIALALVLAACGKDSEPADPVGRDPATLAASGDHGGHGAAPAEDHSAHGGLPEGHAEVEIPADRQQAIGLEVAPAERSRLAGAIRASAVLQADEKRDAHVHSKLMGYVRTLHVNAVGARVKKGQALYSIYSQELLVAQQEYLRALRSSPDLADAARDRLRLWDIPADQIRAIERRGAPLEAVTIRSPITGTVIEKAVVQGHFVEPDMMLFRIADLSRLWVIAEVYEYELGRVDRKGTATVHVEGVAEPLRTQIDYVYPTVDPLSRTVKVRMIVGNRAGQLRPGNFATVELPASSGEVLTVPEQAVIDTGFRSVVYVAAGQGRFRPVEVEVGQRVGGRAEIREGLREGDQVVVAAQFLVDSESRLRAGGPGPGHGGH